MRLKLCDVTHAEVISIWSAWQQGAASITEQKTRIASNLSTDTP
jgi:hypothetical protein